MHPPFLANVIDNPKISFFAKNWYVDFLRILNDNGYKVTDASDILYVATALLLNYFQPNNIFLCLK